MPPQTLCHQPNKSKVNERLQSLRLIFFFFIAYFVFGCDKCDIEDVLSVVLSIKRYVYGLYVVFVLCNETAAEESWK